MTKSHFPVLAVKKSLAACPRVQHLCSQNTQ